MASELLPSEGRLTCGGGVAADPLHVRDIPYSNSAAKFWSALISEIFNRYPRATSIILQTVSGNRLAHRMLFPSAITENDLGDLLAGDPAIQMANTLAALEMYGPPPGVTLSLQEGRRTVLDVAMPADTLDAETFPFLLVWLLDWAHIPTAEWNDTYVSGSWSGEDRRHGISYEVSFDVLRRHMSEGLYSIAVKMRPRISPIPRRD